MRKPLIIALLAASAPLLHAQALSLQSPDPAESDQTIGYASVKEALSALKEKPGVSIREQDGWTIIVDPESAQRQTIWSFTPKGHGAHPAVVKRTAVERDGRISLEMNVLCQAEKAPCDALVQEFQAINARIREQMQQKAAPK